MFSSNLFIAVAPLAGAWIEIITEFGLFCADDVAPLADAWIEIAKGTKIYARRQSHPSRVRGLK